MPYRKINIWQTIDWTTISIYLIMVIFGWFSIYGASYNYDQTSMFDFSGRAGQQMVWIITAVVLAFIILLIEADWYDVFAYWIYALIILLLIVTIFIAPDIKGSRSWLVLGPIRLQPAEFAKYATALAIAKMMNKYKFQLSVPKNFSKVLGLIFLPMLLILMQQETGSALVYLAFFMILYREGMTGSILLIGFSMIIYFVLGIKFDEAMWGKTSASMFLVTFIAALTTVIMTNYYRKERKDTYYLNVVSSVIAVLTVIVLMFYPDKLFDLSWVTLSCLILICGYLFFLFIKNRYRNYLLIGLFGLFSLGFMYSVDFVFDKILEPHQQTRIKVSLGIIDDPGGAGYNVNQSKIAIGSGGFAGKGFLNGTQTKLKYVPEQDTDFIFCTVGEEQGFLGTIAVVSLFVILILRIIYLAERQKVTFNRVYGYAVGGVLFFHFAINIGMVIGITPVIGIPLPFFSYGGSSLWGFTILLFIFLRLDASRTERL
ncbi:MAG: rod shape-determining protein RodA [Candidatus Azobacteroides sp.]|nr:rod shape-determining protein RodA [Candidatus Azobacteroides sp.]